VNKVKVSIALIFVAGLIISLAGQSFGYPPFLAKSRKFGAKDCTFCHVDPQGGPPWNDRGKWLITEKDRRKADIVDVEWLADYKPGKPGDNKGPAPSKLELELTALYNEMIEGARKKETAAFARIVADDFSEITAGGLIADKAAVLASIPNITIESFSVSEISARVFGDTAIMTLRLEAKGSYQGNDMSGDYRETIVWVKREGRWRMVASQSTRLAAR
jgi:ketosteroid isomerase-like protein